MSSIAFGFSRFKLGRRFYRISNQFSKAYPPGLPHVLRDPTQHYKRLIVCCDGTWKSFYRKASDPTNVTRFSRAIDTAHLDQDGKEIQQVLLYQPGVGTGAMNWIQRRFAGMLTLLPRTVPMAHLTKFNSLIRLRPQRKRYRSIHVPC